MRRGELSAARDASMRFLVLLASLKLTLAGMVALGLASIAVYTLEHAASAWLAVPLLLLTLNLVAAVATNGVFRRQTPLLVFHIALVALVALGALGRLTYLNGTAEVTEGAAFSGLARRDAGPLHRGAIDLVSFVNEGFDITYHPGPQRDQTVNRVRWLNERAEEQVTEIGDNRPLVLAGYRFYPTPNKGFAPLLLWHPTRGAPVLGALHLPSYPMNEAKQARTWQPPGTSEELWIMLDFDETLIPADRRSQFKLPSRARLVLRHGDRRWELAPGERVALAGGEVEYRGLRSWMGYTVFYDWTVPWLLAACCVAVASLGWHAWRKLAARPWDA